MDINKLLINVVNLDKYVQFSQDVAANFNNCTVQFNMSTILFLNKIRTFEIEFFNKYGNNGAAIKIIELLLLLPPSPTWRVLGKDLISLLQYWLAFLCKHLIFKNNNWWSYLCTLLQFVKEIRLKESTLSNILVEETADTILSLATHDIPDISQKHKILCVFNLCGADCSREIRFALRTQFDHYFITLAKLLATCGDITFQYSIMETLLRWLLPRHNNNVRLEAAAKWFPDHLYNRKVVDLFLERPWQNFFQDARDFLNMHNECDDLITSVIINKLNIANVALVTGLEKRQHWLDINVGTKCLSFILDPFMVKLLGGSCEAISCETLVVSEDNTREAKLQRQTVDVVLSVTTINAPHMIPSSVSLTGDDYKHLEITISSKTDLTSFDKALRKIFGDKFQESDTFSRPRQLKTGCMVKSNNIRLNLSPSSASTSSLSKLHEKLAALPKADYYKNRVSICAYPELSNVAEVTEAEDHNSSIASACTFKNRNYGVCQKSSLYGKGREVRGEREQQNNNIKCISPSETEQEPVSCLLVATIGSADESIIKDTLERLSKSKDCTTDNVLDLLVQESIQNKPAAIENDETGTEQSHKQNKLLREKVTNVNKTETGNKCTVLSNSTSAEESNTGIVEGTQLSNVNFEKRGYRHRKNISTNNQPAVLSPVKTFDETAVEEFFSQHFAETRNGELIISPSLARKINETSSESSEDFAECCFNENINNEVMPDLEVVECLKFMVNKICDEFDQCEKMLNQDVETICKAATGLEENTIPEEINGNAFELVNEINEKNPVVSNKISVKPVILKFKTTHKPVRGKTVKKRLEPKGPTTKAPAPRKNIIKEKNSKNKVNVVNDAVENVKPAASEENTSLVRRKRKLYSPKTQHWNDDENVIQIAPDDNRSSKTKSKMTCYTEIENVRNDYTKKLRNREPKKKVQPLSPRTKKNNELFDKLKEKTDCNEKIILVDKTNIHNDVAIYNFNSDSEDEDFKESKVKPTSTSAPKNTDTTCVKNKPKCNKVYSAKKKNQSKSNNSIDTPVRTVIDERMRDQPPDILNTSLKVEKPPQKRIRDSLLNLKTEHKMEVMDEDLNTLEQNITKAKVNKKKIKAKNAPTLKSDKKLKVSDILNETSDRTHSPLPGLVVERVHQNVDNSNDSLSAIMLSKFKQIYEKRREPIESCLSTTQVLLSDHDDDDERNEQHEFSPSPVNYIATPRQLPQKEKPSPNKSVTEKRAEKYKKSHKNPNKIVSSIDVPNMDDGSNGERLNMSSCSKKDEERSIETVGYSPITAHGDLEQCQNDLPPNREFLNQSIEPRNMEVDDLNQSIKEFFVQLNREIVKESGNEHGDVESNNSQSGYGNLSPSGVKAKEYRLKSPILSFSHSKGLPTNSGTGSDCNEESCYSRGSKGKAKGKANKTNKESKRSPQRRKFQMSQISPVKLFEDLKPATYRNSDASKSSDSDDEKHTRNIFYKRKPASPDESPKRSQSYWLRSNRDKRSSIESAVSSSTKKSPVKRKSSIESSQRTKSRRLEEGGVFRKKSDSCTSGTDLNDWFRSMKPTTSKVATLDGVFKENMTYVIEKLDTTVNEIHHNTDKRLINMFVEAQSQLDANKELRNSLYKSTAKELFADMVKLIDARFSDMNAKSDEMDRKFMAELKERARVIITDDCRKKKAIVRLLREDVQAVVDFINKEK